MQSLININIEKKRRIKETKSIKKISTEGLVQDRIRKAAIAITEDVARKKMFLNTTLNMKNAGSNFKPFGLMAKLFRRKK